MATLREVFTSLSTRFRFDAKMVEKILEAGINTLSDFRYFCSTEVVQTFVTPVETLQILGLRRRGARRSNMAINL